MSAHSLERKIENDWFYAYCTKIDCKFFEKAPLADREKVDEAAAAHLFFANGAVMQ